jgi:hypothetical protein
MMWSLLAPGHSASKEIAESLRGQKLGVVGCAYQLAPWADFIAASDRAWWDKYPEAHLINDRYSMLAVRGVELAKVPGFKICNSGVLALDIARQRGATEIHLYGFDMHGSHFFGEYNNGLTNALPDMRKKHLREYRQWAAMNKNIIVLNFTRGSAIDCFPKVR